MAKSKGDTNRAGKRKRLTASQRGEIAERYGGALPRYNALLEEVVFILEDKISQTEIKIHAIERRIKSLESVVNKCDRKVTDDIRDLVDIVGIRVVCLFRSDMPKIGALIRSNFDVVDVDDKIPQGGPLGYMSVHYVCKIPGRYTGPRYENTRDLLFEIQVRTLCMHAWAAVSHYLDYKGDWDVPEDLKRALSALGGLFYVADSEFEQFYAARVQSRILADKEVAADKGQEINLDTMRSFLERKYPKRRSADLSNISNLVHEIKDAGYTSIEEIDRDLNRGVRAFESYEAKHPPRSEDSRYTSVGVVRVTLRIISEPMRSVGIRVDRLDHDDLKQYEEFEHLVD